MASTLFVAAPEESDSVPSRVSVTDLLLLCMAFLWGVNFIVVKFATGVFAPLAFNSTRILLAVIVLWAIVLGRGLALPSRRDVVALLALGVLGNGLYQILFVEGLARTRASDAALLLAASPAMIELIGLARGFERIGWRGVLGIVLSLAGIGLVVSGASNDDAGGSTMLGNALTLGACLCWSVYSVFLKPLTQRVEGVTLSAVTMTGGLVVMLIFGAPALAATKWAAIPLIGWEALAYSGLLALVVAYLFWYRGVKVLGPTRAAMYSNLQPVVAMAVAWALLSEVPRPAQLAGALCIIGGLVLTRLPAPQAAVATR
jgi:drug/metabolite transporter (DMT)-like permease